METASGSAGKKRLSCNLKTTTATEEEDEEDYLQEGVIIGEKSPGGGISQRVRYQLEEMMGVGKFGEVWMAIELLTGRKVAVKFEDLDLAKKLAARIGIQNLQHNSLDLRNERHALALAKGPGVPEVFYFSEDRPELLVLPVGAKEAVHLHKQMLVQQLLEYNLQKLVGRLKTSEQRALVSLEAGIQLLRIMQRLHSVGLLHCDISLNNIMIGRGRSKKLDSFFFVDFGLASAWMRDGKPLRQEPDREDGIFNGTQDFVSTAVLLGADQARRDDVMALLLCLICFVRGGKLPWSHTRDYHEVAVLKSTISPAELCEGCPAAFIDMLEHVESLTFSCEPDYALLTRLFESFRPCWFDRSHLEGLLHDPPLIPPQLAPTPTITTDGLDTNATSSAVLNDCVLAEVVSSHHVTKSAEEECTLASAEQKVQQSTCASDMTEADTRLVDVDEHVASTTEDVSIPKVVGTRSNSLIEIENMSDMTQDEIARVDCSSMGNHCASVEVDMSATHQESLDVGICVNHHASADTSMSVVESDTSQTLEKHAPEVKVCREASAVCMRHVERDDAVHAWQDKDGGMSIETKAFDQSARIDDDAAVGGGASVSSSHEYPMQFGNTDNRGGNEDGSRLDHVLDSSQTKHVTISVSDMKACQPNAWHTSRLALFPEQGTAAAWCAAMECANESTMHEACMNEVYNEEDALSTTSGSLYESDSDDEVLPDYTSDEAICC